MSTEVSKAIAKLKQTNPKAKVAAIYKYGNDIMLEAPSMKNDISDPFYIYSVKNDVIIPFNPMMNFKGFQQAMRNPIKGA